MPLTFDVFEEVRSENEENVRLKYTENYKLNDKFGILPIVIKSRTKQNFTIDAIASICRRKFIRKQFKLDKSVLAFPVINNNEMLGVIQFINKLDADNQTVIDFDQSDEEIVQKIFSFITIQFFRYSRTYKSKKLVRYISAIMICSE